MSERPDSHEAAGPSGDKTPRTPRGPADTRDTPPPLDEPPIEPAKEPPFDVYAGRSIGPYRVRRTLRAGGMGVVCLAEHPKLSRDVAIKLIRGDCATEELMARFAQETKLLARLRHPNVAVIHDWGTLDDDGGPRPYFVMEYVPEARTITAYADAHELGIRARVELMTKVCDAVQHAHHNLVIHRDITPGNILVDADGEPKLIDFGIARDEWSNRRFTAHTHRVGTPLYMSPEQVSRPKEVDARTDVYSLGVVLYELVCGRHPLGEKTLTDIYRAITDEEPARPSTRRPGIDRSVETALLQAIEKRRDRRYQSPAELAADLRRWLAGERPLAVPKSPLVKVAERLARNRWQTAAAALVLLVLVVTGLAGYWWRSERSLNEAFELERAARSAALIGSAEAAIIASQPAVAADALGRVEQVAARFELRHLRHRIDESVARYEPHGRPRSIAADGASLLVAIDASSPGQSPLLSIGLVETDAALQPSPVPRPATPSGAWRRVAVSADGALIAVGSFPRGKSPARLLVLDRRGTTLAALDPGGGAPLALTFHPTRSVLVAGIGVGGGPGKILAWDLDTPPNGATGSDAPLEPAFELAGPMREPKDLSFSPDGTILAAACEYDHAARLWRIPGARPERTRDEPPTIPCAAVLMAEAGIRSVAFRPASRATTTPAALLATAGMDDRIVLWDALDAVGRGTATPTSVPIRLTAVQHAVLTVKAEQEGVLDVAWSPTGRHLYTTGVDRTVGAWELDGGHALRDLTVDAPGRTDGAPPPIVARVPDLRRIATMHGHEQELDRIAVLASGLVATSSRDGTVRFWRRREHELPTLGPHGSSVADVAFSPNGRHVASVGFVETFVHDVETLELIALRREAGKIHAWAVSWRDDRTLLVGTGETVHVLALDAASHTLGPVGALAHDEAIAVRRVAARGDRIAAGLDDGSILVWSGIDDPSPVRIPAHASGGAVRGLLWLDDTGGRLAAAAEDDERIVIVDARAGTTTAVQAGIPWTTLARRGDRLAAGTADGRIALLDLDPASGAVAGPRWLDGAHAGPIESLAFHPSEPRLASGSRDGTLRVWDTASGLEIVAFRGRLFEVRALAFDPKGHRLASGHTGPSGVGNVARLWEDAAPPPARVATRAVVSEAMRFVREHDGASLPAVRRAAAERDVEPDVVRAIEALHPRWK